MSVFMVFCGPHLPLAFQFVCGPGGGGLQNTWRDTFEDICAVRNARRHAGAPTPNGLIPCGAGGRCLRDQLSRGLFAEARKAKTDASQFGGKPSSKLRMIPLRIRQVAIHLFRDPLPRVRPLCDSHRLRIQLALRIGGNCKFQRGLNPGRQHAKRVLRRGAAEDSSAAPKAFAQLPFPCGLLRRRVAICPDPFCEGGMEGQDGREEKNANPAAGPRKEDDNSILRRCIYVKHSQVETGGGGA